jgi:hypothetical protein
MTFRSPRSQPETGTTHCAALSPGSGSNMWALINVLYQEYCRARLAEIRRVIR